MSTTTTEPTEIEKKQGKTSNPAEPTGPNLWKFSLKVIHVFLILVLIYFINGLALHVMKVAQANLFPTDLYCFPYETELPSYGNKTQAETNIFETFNNNNQPKGLFTQILEFFNYGDGEKLSEKVFFPLTQEAVTQRFFQKFPNFQEGSSFSLGGENLKVEKSDAFITKVYDLAKEALAKNPDDPLGKSIKDYVDNFYSPLIYNFTNFFPEWFTKTRQETNNSFVFMFLTTIQEVVCAASQVQSKIFNFLNQWPEQWMYHLYFPGMVLFNMFFLMVFPLYTLLRSVLNLKYFLREKDPKATSSIESDKWTERTGFGYIWGLVVLCFFAFAFGFICFMTTHVVSAFLFFSVFVAAVFTRSFKINPETGQEECTSAWQTAWEAFLEYKGSFIFIFLIVGVLLPAFGTLGPQAGVSALIVIALGYLGYGIRPNLTVQNLFQGLSAVVSKDQVEKKCNVKPTPAESKSFWESLLLSNGIDENKLSEQLSSSQEEEEEKKEEEKKVQNQEKSQDSQQQMSSSDVAAAV